MNAAVAQFQLDAIVTVELIHYAELMVDGVISRYGTKINDRDSARQECLLNWLTVLPRVNLANNAFGYLTTCLINNLRQFYRTERIRGKFISVDMSVAAWADDPQIRQRNKPAG